MIHHMRELARVMPLFGFYLLTGVGGIRLPHHFWRELVEIENIVAIKIAPFDRYGTLDVAGVADAGRGDEITLYTGNDDSIVYDFITPYHFGPRQFGPARAGRADPGRPPGAVGVLDEDARWSFTSGCCASSTARKRSRRSC